MSYSFFIYIIAAALVQPIQKFNDLPVLLLAGMKKYETAYGKLEGRETQFTLLAQRDSDCAYAQLPGQKMR